MAAGVTQPDANRTPVLDVTYGDRFKLNSVDIRTVAITHPKVIGTNTAVGTAFEDISPNSLGQTLDAGVRIKCTSTNGVYVHVHGATLDGSDGFRLDQGDEVFIETSQLSTVKVKSVSGSSEDITYIAT